MESCAALHPLEKISSSLGGSKKILFQTLQPRAFQLLQYSQHVNHSSIHRLQSDPPTKSPKVTSSPMGPPHLAQVCIFTSSILISSAAFNSSDIDLFYTSMKSIMDNWRVFFWFLFCGLQLTFSPEPPQLAQLQLGCGWSEICDTVETVKTVEIVETVNTRLEWTDVKFWRTCWGTIIERKNSFSINVIGQLHAACYSYRVYLSSLFFRSIARRRNSSSFFFFGGGDNQVVDPIFNAKFLKRK